MNLSSCSRPLRSPMARYIGTADDARARVTASVSSSLFVTGRVPASFVFHPRCSWPLCGYSFEYGESNLIDRMNRFVDEPRDLVDEILLMMRCSFPFDATRRNHRRQFSYCSDVFGCLNLLPMTGSKLKVDVDNRFEYYSLDSQFSVKG